MLKTKSSLKKSFLKRIQFFVSSNIRKRNGLSLIVFFLVSSAYSQLDSKHYFPPMKQGGANQAIVQQAFYLSTPVAVAFDVNVYQGTNPLPVGTINISNTVSGIYHVADNDNDITLLTDVNTGVVLSNSGLRFESTTGDDFYVNYRGRSGSQAASLTTKGEKALGTLFKWGGLPLRGSHSSLSSYVGIMATEDNTIIDITDYHPDSEFRNGTDPDGITVDNIQITLNAGETYVLQALKNQTVINEDGWLGATIRSDKNIAISNGGLNVGVRTGSNGRDAAIDQPVPENVIGQEYVFIRGNGANETEFPLIIATQDGTEIYVNGSATPIATINKGEYFEIPGSNYSTTTSGGNMYVRTSRDVYAYQCITGASQHYTLGLNFIAPVNCLLPSELNNIPDIRDVDAKDFDGGVTIVASQSTPDSAITITHGGGTLTGGTDFTFTNVAGSTWKTVYQAGLTGDVQVNSSGPIAVGFLGVSGAAGIAGYFSGFDTVPAVVVDINGGGCFPGSALEEVTGGFANYAWYQGTDEITGTLLVSGPTMQTFDPTTSGLGEYFVRVTDFGGCSYNSAVVTLFSCDPDLQVTKTDNVDPIDAGSNLTFTITATSSSVDPITNVVLTDVIPTEFDIVNVTTETGTWIAPNWTIGTMNPGDSFDIVIEVKIKDNASGTVTNNVSYNFTEIATETNILIDDLNEPVTINPCNTASPPSSTPSLCVNSPLTNITHTTTIATGIGIPTGLPSGVTASWNSNTITISGTPTNTGVFNYNIPLTGGCNTVSATGTITVNALPVANPITGPTEVCVNGTIDLTEGTTGTTIVWNSSDTGVATIDTDGMVTGVTAGATDITYTVTDANGCTSLSSSVYTVTINPLPVLTSLSSNSPICEGNDAEFTISGSANAILTYNINGNANQTVTLDGSGDATITSISATSNVTINLVSLEASITNCSITLTNSETVTVNTNPTLASTNDIIVCDDMSGTQSLDANSGITLNPNTSVVWYDAPTGGNIVASPIVNTATPSTDPPTSFYAEITDTSSSCVNPVREEVKLQIVSPPFPNLSETVCSDEALNIGLSFATTYTVSSSDPTNVPAAADRSTAATGNITDTYTNTTGNPVTITYTVTIQDGSPCDGNIFDIVVTVNPEPSNTTAPTETICSNSTLSHDLNSDVNVSGSSFSWSAVDNPNITGETVSGGTGTTINDTLVNTSGTSQVVTYTIIPTSGNSCQGDAFSYTVTVKPEISITNQPIATQTICVGATPTDLSVTVIGGVDGLDYQWQSSATSGSGFTDISGATNAMYTPVTTTAGTTYYQVVISDSSGVCSDLISSESVVIINED
uniref:PKD-like domain-containing protein n=1 Tax=Tenacibaculum mesophilum TaxID=104268 RepID=UPI0009E2A9E7